MTTAAIWTIIFVIFSVTIIESCKSPENDYIIPLTSENNFEGGWKLKNKNGTIAEKATVPGGIYTDLMRAKIIDDIFFKDNDIKTRWVSKDNWIYQRTFNVSKATLDKKVLNLIFDGIDTVANITVNGQLVGSTDNMFVKYSFDVKQILKEGSNEIKVEFESPIDVANKRSKLFYTQPECVPSYYNGECHANQIRKMQASFSWDWGPAFPSVGIWKPVYLTAYDGAIITDVTTELKYVDDRDSVWFVTFNISLETAPQEILEGHLFVTIQLNRGIKFTVNKFVQETSTTKNTIQKQLVAQIPGGQVDLWWPNGYGESPLYPAEITFQNTRSPDEYYKKTINIGFRTIELIQKPIKTDDMAGLSFYFNVNGLPIFMKGSNSIPMSILPELGYDNATVDTLLHAAKDANMNMLRVWGGGVYESDYFYDKCDELGILIWQDLMFACSMYPVDADFLKSVSVEVQQAVTRLQHHASIALWAGNNENEAALRGNWYNTASQFEKYKKEYIKLYVDVIRPIIQTADPTRTYMVSSPSNGIKSEEEGFVAQNPYDPLYGDTHYYNYLEDLWAMETYPKARFSSEYGYQSLPSLETWMTATNETSDLDIESQFMKLREHQIFNDYTNMLMQMEKQMGVPNINDVDYFNTFIYYSQIVQAMAMKTETEYYRQSREDWMTMGALYWQLNDVWQAPSWSSIEFGGKWKMLHYFARDFFSPVLVSPRLYLYDEMAVYVMNDRPIPIIDGTVTIEVYNWSGFEKTKTINMTVSLKPLETVKKNVQIDLPTMEDRKKIFYKFSLTDNTGKKISPDNYIYPIHLKDIVGFKQSKLELTILEQPRSRNDRADYEIQVKSDGIALFVWIDVPHSVGFISENGFMMTEPTKKITLHTRKAISSDELKKILKVRSLYVGK